MAQEFAKLSITSPDSRETHIRKDSVLSIEISGNERNGFSLTVTYGLPGSKPQAANYFSNSRAPFDSFLAQLAGNAGDVPASPEPRLSRAILRDTLAVTRGADGFRRHLDGMAYLPEQEYGWTVRKTHGNVAYSCCYRSQAFGIAFRLVIVFAGGTASVQDISRTDSEWKLTNNQYNRCIRRFVTDIILPYAETDPGFEYEYSGDSPATPGENP